jgi:hypothetical protein
MSEKTTKVISNQTLLEIFDKWSYELEDNDNSIRVGHLAETYYQVMTHSALQKEIDPKVMEDRLAHYSSSDAKFTAKDVFNVLYVTESKEVIDGMV